MTAAAATSQSHDMKIPVQFFAIPAAIAAIGYDAIRQKMSLPKLPLSDKTEDLKSRIYDLIAAARSDEPSSRSLQSGASSSQPVPDHGSGVPQEGQDVSGAEPKEDLPPLPPMPEEHPPAEAGDAPLQLQVQLQDLLKQAAARVGQNHAEELNERRRLQRYIDNLRDENEQLRASCLMMQDRLAAGGRTVSSQHRTGALELYTDLVSLLCTTKSGLRPREIVPWVVAVGRQGVGKSSVLSMLAKANLLPRAQGGAMTTVPIEVHTAVSATRKAEIEGGAREYDLTIDDELSQLRQALERQMKANLEQQGLPSGETKPLELHVTGPGYPPMLLVDLPSVEEPETDAGRKSRTLLEKYMASPNAVLLCVQDKPDEDKWLRDFVGKADPEGKSTFYVSTKADQWEQLSASQRYEIEQLYKARQSIGRGFYATVTGGGPGPADYDTIRSYEAVFFEQSSLVKSGVLDPQQTTTGNLSRAVAKEFWKKAVAAVAGQVDALGTKTAVLEAEWKTIYRCPIFTPDELLQLGKHVVLDSVADFASQTAREWEDQLRNTLQASLTPEFVSNIYCEAAKAGLGGFKNACDTLTTAWVQADLPRTSLNAAQQLFLAELERTVKSAVEKNMPDGTFRPLADAVIAQSRKCNLWTSDLPTNLKTLDANAFDDDEMDAGDWLTATQFMISVLVDRQKVAANGMEGLVGPDLLNQWLGWTKRTPQQTGNEYIRLELLKIMSTEQRLKPVLSYEDVVTVRKNVKTSQGLEVTDDNVSTVYNQMYYKKFLEQSIESAKKCQDQYQVPASQLDDVPNGLACKDVLLFWRMQEAIKQSSKAMRQHIASQRVRIEEEAQLALDDVGSDNATEVLHGDRVALAAEIESERKVYHQCNEMLRDLQTASKPATLA